MEIPLKLEDSLPFYIKISFLQGEAGLIFGNGKENQNFLKVGGEHTFMIL